MTIAMAEEPIMEAPSSARHEAESGEHDDGLSAFADVRPRLFGIAYRMLGSVAEAEDIVQRRLAAMAAYRSARGRKPGSISRNDNHKTLHQPHTVRPFTARNLHGDVASRTGGHKR
jgi:hypothetical protein